MNQNIKELKYIIANDRNIWIYKFMVFIVSIFMIFILFAWAGAEIGTKLWSWNALIIFLALLWPVLIGFSQLAIIPIYIFNILWEKIIWLKGIINKRRYYIREMAELLELVNTLHNLMRKILFLEKICLFFLTKKLTRKSKYPSKWFKKVYWQFLRVYNIN